LVAITLGRDFGSEVEVLSGIDANSKVITNPPDSVIDGEKVNPTQPKNGQQNAQQQADQTHKQTQGGPSSESRPSQ
jgi:hypothetical protein